jgi:hypothetical protein
MYVQMDSSADGHGLSLVRPKFALFLSFQGQFCKLTLLRVIFNSKLGDYYAIRSQCFLFLTHTVFYFEGHSLSPSH